MAYKPWYKEDLPLYASCKTSCPAAYGKRGGFFVLASVPYCRSPTPHYVRSEEALHE